MEHYTDFFTTDNDINSIVRDDIPPQEELQLYIGAIVTTSYGNAIIK